MQTRRHHFPILKLLAITAAGALLPTAQANATDFIAVPEVQWTPCFEELGPFQCALYTVPLDYSEASSSFYLSGAEEGIEIALVRLPATDQENKIGSLLLNPGGPGGSGVGFVLNAGPFLYTSEVRARFDLIGFDPRGTNASTPLRCLTSFDLLDELFALPAYPEDLSDAAAQIDVESRITAECDLNAGPILDNMATADVARDMDILRAAVGDEQLTYAGFSYGSFLGVTYANLFPDRVRALIVDAVLDPIQWTTGERSPASRPFSTRLRSAAGAGATLEEFFRLCDLAGPDRCAVAGDAAARFDALIARIAEEPIVLVFEDGSELVIDNVFLVSITLGVLYNPFQWAFFALDLAFLESLAGPIAASQEFNIIGRGFREENPNVIPQTIEAFPGVACSDSDNPSNPFVWLRAAGESERQFGYFGPTWTWASSPCASWPGSKSSRYAGPFTGDTANPVLVTSTVFDPATRYEGAVTVFDLLPNSHLLTVEGWGHTTLFLSNCATQIASDYLVDIALPGSTSNCRVDAPPFFLSPDEVYPPAGPSSLEVDPSAAKTAAEHRERALRSIAGTRRSYSAP